MGFQNQTGTVTVHAKLTDQGKKYLLTDSGRFTITKFSPFDDEVDYTLWNTSHDNGDQYWGSAIENLPILEPSVSSLFQARYNLVKDMPRGQLRQCVLTLSPSTVTLTYIDTVKSIKADFENCDETHMTVVLLDNTKADITAPGAQVVDVNPLAVQDFIGQSGFTYAKGFIVPVNTAIEVHAKRNELKTSTTVTDAAVQTQVIFAGVNQNVRQVATVTVNANTTIDT